MFRSTILCRRTPMIQFTYAIKKNGGKAFSSASASVRAGSAAAADKAGVRSGLGAATILEFYDELPAIFRPRPLSDFEMETVLMGGAAPYTPKHLLKKKK